MTTQALTAEPAAPSPPPPSPRRISVADRVARAFPPLACVHGFRAFAEKRVDVTETSDDDVEAEVRGKRTQRVRLRAQGGRLATTCTCSPETVGPAACRHVWATLLEVDRRALFASFRETRRALLLTVMTVTPKPAAAVKVKVEAKEKAKPAPKPPKAKEPKAKAASRAAGRPSARSPRATAPRPAPQARPRRGPRRP